MGKISRKAFEKDAEITSELATSHVKFVDHVKKIHKYFMSEIEQLEDRISKLEAHTNIKHIDAPKVPEAQSQVQSEYS